MPYEEFLRPYEVLIRYENGAPKAIQLINEKGVVKDNEVIQRSECLAQPHELAGFALTDLIGETTAAALLEVTRLNELLEEREIKITQLVQANGGDIS